MQTKKQSDLLTKIIHGILDAELQLNLMQEKEGSIYFGEFTVPARKALLEANCAYDALLHQIREDHRAECDAQDEVQS